MEAARSQPRACFWDCSSDPGFPFLFSSGLVKLRPQREVFPRACLDRRSGQEPPAPLALGSCGPTQMPCSGFCPPIWDAPCCWPSDLGLSDPGLPASLGSSSPCFGPEAAPAEGWGPHRQLLSPTPALLAVRRPKHTSHTFVWFSGCVWQGRAPHGTGSFSDAGHLTGQARNDLDEVLALKYCAAKYEDWNYADADDAKIKQDLSTEQSGQHPVCGESEERSPLLGKSAAFSRRRKLSWVRV